MAKSKLLELDIVRAIAILAVLTIHGTSEATVELESGGAAQSVYLAVNKLSNFAVPVFIFLSGLVLFYRYSGDWNARRAVQFYRRRIQQIVIPYLIWSLLYYLFYQWLEDRPNLHMDWGEFAKLLPWADTTYHLYFIIIIVQFYLLFPLLMSMATAFPRFGRSLWLFGLIVQAIFFSINRWGYYFEHFSSICFNYFAVFGLGGFIGLYYDRCVSWVAKRIVWILPLTALVGLSFVMVFELEERDLLSISGLWYQPLFTLYAALAAVSLIWLGRTLLVKAPGGAKALLALGAASFGIYLLHPAVLSAWRTYLHPEQTGGYHVYTIAAFLLSLAVPWLLVVGYGKLTRLLFRRKAGLRARA